MSHCVVQDLTEGLISTEDFGRMDSIKTKPAVLTAGFECFDSVESKDGLLDTPILTDSPNLHKQRSESVSKEFIKLIRNDETEFLLKNHPNVFLLLTLIALRARLYEGHPDGLKIGESFNTFFGITKNIPILFQKWKKRSKRPPSR